MDNYFEYHFTISPLEGRDLVVAVLDPYGFDSFVETEQGLLAYTQRQIKDEYIKQEPLFQKGEYKINWVVNEVEPQNWNETWERQFEPITVDEQVHIRAIFHPKSNYPYDIEITPKMSFGTGHHETTHMMVSQILNTPINGNTLLDMGCGTGVLGILAEKLGASEILGIDIEDWAVTNTKENIEANNCKKMEVLLGDKQLLKDQKFEVILANINRNVLLSDIPIYARCLNPKGILILSGFYKEDLHLIDKVCKGVMLNRTNTLEKNNWIAAKYVH